MDWLTEHYLLIKALHIIAVITWMAGMLYLPRLFAYHCRVKPGSEASELFKVMERKLLRVIVNPSMIAVYTFGILLMLITDAHHQKWFHYKLALVIILTILHHMMARYRKQFDRDANTKSEKFYRVFNEIPAVLMIGIVILAVLKPL